MQMKQPVTNNENFQFTLLSKNISGVFWMLVIIFIGAKRLDYWQGWCYCSFVLLVFIFTNIFFLNRADLLREREKPGPGVKRWDNIILKIFTPLFFLIVIVASLDAGRFNADRKLPVLVYLFAYFTLVFSQGISFWAMRINKFFSSAVRIQKDRGHRVVSKGPYTIIRHPGYLSIILSNFATALVLGSLWALIPAGVASVLIIIRTYLEDKLLQKELSGYYDYAKKVKYRILPYIW